MSQKIKTYINNYANNSEELYIKCESGNDFVDAILNVKYNYARKHRIELTTDFAGKLNLPDINENIIATVIANITQNAFEALNKVEKNDKQVNIRTSITDASFNIYITNNGPQIPQSVKNKIFDLGYSTNSNNTKERGYGLSIVKAHIETAGGSIKVESSLEQTEFIISLPLKKQVILNNTQMAENWV
jgi:sensor histidine kinase regulating citrate/malate metabolism